MHSARSRSIKTCTRCIHATTVFSAGSWYVWSYADRRVAETLVFSRETSRMDGFRDPSTSGTCSCVHRGTCGVHTTTAYAHRIREQDVHEPATRRRFRSVCDTRGTAAGNQRKVAICIANSIAGISRDLTDDYDLGQLGGDSGACAFSNYHLIDSLCFDIVFVLLCC